MFFFSLVFIIFLIGVFLAASCPAAVPLLARTLTTPTSFQEVARSRAAVAATVVAAALRPAVVLSMAAAEAMVCIDNFLRWYVYAYDVFFFV